MYSRQVTIIHNAVIKNIEGHTHTHTGVFIIHGQHSKDDYLFFLDKAEFAMEGAQC